MTEVTDVIVSRQLRNEPFNAMVMSSLAFHAVLLGLLLFGPFNWGLHTDEQPRTVMTISLAGAPGPRSGGLTPTGGRAVPPPPPEAVPRNIPAPAPKPAAAPARPARRPPPKPVQAEEPRPGVTRTETGARGQGFGLSTGGSGGSGVQLDVANFCCPEYIEQLVTLIQRNWQANQGVVGTTVMKFTITRAGLIQGVMVERPSGFVALDLAAERALLITRLPELPVQYPNGTLGIHLTFAYQR
jgi:outer membrane biosynthesis protein TonB